MTISPFACGEDMFYFALAAKTQVQSSVPRSNGNNM